MELAPDELCKCQCHVGSVADRWRGGVRVVDVVEAAIACESCLHRHAPALLSKRLANEEDPLPRDRAPYQDTPQPKDEGEGVE